MSTCQQGTGAERGTAPGWVWGQKAELKPQFHVKVYPKRMRINHTPGFASGVSAYSDHQRDLERSFHPAPWKIATLAYKALIRTPGMAGLPEPMSSLPGCFAATSEEPVYTALLGFPSLELRPGRRGRGLRLLLPGGRKEGSAVRHSKESKGSAGRGLVGGEGGSFGPAQAAGPRSDRQRGTGRVALGRRADSPSSPGTMRSGRSSWGAA